MKIHQFTVGDLIVSEQGTVALVHHINENMNGNKAIFLMISKRKDISDAIPYAVVDYILEGDIKSGRYKYFPVIN